jgi:nucleoside diphosphate kinase
MAEFKDERTLVIIKPDGVQRTLIGEIIKRYSERPLSKLKVKQATLKRLARRKNNEKLAKLGKGVISGRKSKR